MTLKEKKLKRRARRLQLAKRTGLGLGTLAVTAGLAAGVAMDWNAPESAPASNEGNPTATSESSETALADPNVKLMNWLRSDKTWQQVPQVKGSPIFGDSTNSPLAPPVVPNDKRCGTLVSWKSLDDCMGDEKWYTDGVDRLASETGFDWDHVEWMAEHERNVVSDTRIIEVININVSDDQARDHVRDLVKDDKAVDKMSIVRHGCIMNTRGMEKDQLNEFSDCTPMVRVSLGVFQWDDKEKRAEFAPNSGVFVDCYNLWWLGRVEEKPAPPAPPSGTGTPPPPTRTTTPPTRTTTTPPTRTTTTTTPPTRTTTTPPPTTTTTTLQPKPPIIPSGTQGAGHNEHDGEGESTIPDPPTATTTRVDPPPPASSPDPASTPDPDPAPAPDAGTSGEEIAELPGTDQAEDGTPEFHGGADNF